LSRTTILNYIQTKVAALPGVTRVSIGEPEPDIPATDLPLVVLDVAQTRSQQMTFDNAVHTGKRHDTYEVLMTVYLGLPTMPKKRAVADQLVYSERFVTAFMPDYKLGGNCYDSKWLEPDDNIAGGLYKDLGEHPKMRFRLDVTEETTMGG
jgi:hypothetical protein